MIYILNCKVTKKFQHYNTLPYFIKHFLKIIVNSLIFHRVFVRKTTDNFSSGVAVHAAEEIVDAEVGDDDCKEGCDHVEVVVYH